MDNPEIVNISRRDCIITLTLGQPQSLSIQGKHELLTAIRKVANDPDARVLIISQGHPEAFLVNVGELVEMTPAGYGMPFTTTLAMEQGAFASLFGTPDQRNRMNAFLSGEEKENRTTEVNEKAVLVLQKEKPSCTFINTWSTADLSNQQQLLLAMKEDSAEIQKQAGFDGLAFHLSKDGRQLVVFSRWKTEEDFNRNIEQNPVMTTAREKLSKFGAPSGNMYRTESI